MSTTFSYQVSNLLEKMSSPDKDFRFMATNDLMAELQKDAITLDDDTERKVVKTLLKLLDDKNGEVQNLAVRCLAPLVHKIKTQQLETMVDTLCQNMESQNDRLRDVSSIALKTVMAELPGGASATSVQCVRRVIPRLTEGLCVENKTDASVKLEILDILNNVIKRFGRSFGLNFEEIERAVFLQLEKERQALRKRSIHTLGALVDVVPNDHYDRIVQKVVNGCTENAKNTNNLRTYVSAATSICRNSPARFANFLPNFVPQFIDYCQQIDDDELREACLQAFETFITRCTKDLTPFMSQIIEITSQLVKYDPNYHYDEDADGSMMETDDISNGDGDQDDDEEADDDADEYSDDDDLSWKVRRSAAKCIESLITYHPDRLYEHYNVLGPLLISRFKEREDNVKYDIFQGYTSLLKQTRVLIPEYFHQRQQAYTSSADVGGERIQLDQFQKFIHEELSANQRKIFEILGEQSPTLIRAIYAQLKGRNLKTRQQCFALLSHLLRALPGALTNSFQLMISPIQSTLNDKTADGNMKINTLQFIDVSMRTHDPKTLVPFINAITPLVVKAIQDPFYKISAEALTVTMSLIRVLRPLCAEVVVTQCDCSTHVSQIYTAIVTKLKISDVDQEVKEKTISATGLLVSIFADQKNVKLDECLPLLLERLRNEMTRYVTVKALNTIVCSPLKIAEISKILPDVLPLLADFLRKNQRTLRITTLTLLESLVSKFSQGGLESSGLIRVVKEVPSLISEQDLQISLLSLRFMTDVINAYPDQISDSLPNLFNSLITLTQSSLLQGATLNAALGLFVALVKSPLPNKPTFEEIVDRLSAVAYESRPQLLHRQAYISIAKSVAVVAHAHADLTKANKLITKLQALLNTDSQHDSVRLFAILTLGELGRIYSTVFNSIDIEPETLIIRSFNCHLEELKTAASYALGSLAVGDLGKFLPFLLKEINENPKRQYLLLHALKEVISSESSAEASESNQVFRAGIEQIWQVLVEHCSCDEEGTRNIVAECLGKLCLIDPQRFIPDLLQRSRDLNPKVRGTAVTAVRFMITDHPLPVDEFLRPAIGQFLETMEDPDLQVRRVAIVTLNSAAHNKPKLIRDCLQSLLPSLYSETKVKKELVYEVEMGPFKHVVDDGLDLRKAAFECMYTLAEQCIDKIDVFEYMKYVENGLTDQHDIKLLTFLMLIRISSKCALQLSQRIDQFCDLIKPQLLLKPKQNAVKQENEKQDELKRAAVRAVMALKRVPNHDRSQKLSDLVEIIRSNPDLAAMHESLERDSSMRAGGFGIGMEVMETE